MTEENKLKIVTHPKTIPGNSEMYTTELWENYYGILVRCPHFLKHIETTRDSRNNYPLNSSLLYTGGSSGPTPRLSINFRAMFLNKATPGPQHFPTTNFCSLQCLS